MQSRIRNEIMLQVGNDENLIVNFFPVENEFFHL